VDQVLHAQNVLAAQGLEVCGQQQQQETEQLFMWMSKSLLSLL
jgi:hypothetical protein